MSQSPVLIVLHLPTLVHVYLTLSIWCFFAAAVVVQLADRRVLLILVIVDWCVAASFLREGIL